MIPVYKFFYENEEEILVINIPRIMARFYLACVPAFFGIVAADAQPRMDSPSPPGIRVIVAGLGRTGTLSLARALEQLGETPFHLEEFTRNPDTLTLWKNLAEREIDATQLLTELVRRNYTATLDNPSSELFREQLSLFPNARVILSLHPLGAAGWARSFRALLRLVRVQAGEFQLWYPNILRFLPFVQDFDAVRCVMGTKMRGQAQTSLSTSLRKCELMFEGLDKPEGWLEEIYEKHNAAVRSFVPAEQLLEYRVVEGWEPLCKFLRKDESCGKSWGDFPHAMLTTSAGLNLMRVVVLAIIYGWFPCAVLLCLLCWHCCGRRILKGAISKDKEL